MKLPEAFASRMKSLLGDSEYEDFAASYSKPRQYGLFVNTLKISVDKFLGITPFRLEKVDWAGTGFYYDGKSDNPGKHPHYYTGLYYIQEPSAMLPGEAACMAPGDKVLDICAAPGGKTVRIAARMRNEGFLAVNDISRSRINALIKNIEICGIRNAVVFNETPDRLAGVFRAYFDVIIADVPCSGEGMFRKDPDAAAGWERYCRRGYPSLQGTILANAYEMLKPGGRIVYSTCTFEPEENEGVITDFLNLHNDCTVIPVCGGKGVTDTGRPDWAGNRGQRPEIAGTARIWPHKSRGEGHFTAVLGKAAGECFYSAPGLSDRYQDTLELEMDVSIIEAYRRFEDKYLNLSLNGSFITRGKELYLKQRPVTRDNDECLPSGMGKLKTVRPGWHLGSLTAGGGFSPSGSLAAALGMSDIRFVLDYPSDFTDAARYLKGETIEKGIDAQNGYAAVCIDGYTAGWAKQQREGYMKNMYPPGWRLQ